MTPPTETRETTVGIGGAAESTDMVLNIGPQHPSTHGVLRLRLVLDGERIQHAEPVIGYMHRGAEKLFDLPAKGAVDGGEARLALRDAEVEKLVEEARDGRSGLAGRLARRLVHGGGYAMPPSSRKSQAWAKAKSRFTVRVETARASAVSSIERPPK